MPGMSPGAALRELQQAQAGLRKARELLKQAKDNPPVAAEAYSTPAGRAWPRPTGMMAAIPPRRPTTPCSPSSSPSSGTRRPFWSGCGGSSGTRTGCGLDADDDGFGDEDGED